MEKLAAIQLLGGSMFPVQRRQHIVDFLHRHGSVTLQQLASAMQVSVSTLRRDLDGLVEEGVVDRTHGGALLRHQPYNTFEPEFSAAQDLSPHEKRAIGIAAAESLLPGQCVIFDSGSTVLEAARAVVARKIALLAVTNDLQIAQILSAGPSMGVHVFGGQLRSGSNTLLGTEVLVGARSMRADVLLFGAHALAQGAVSETSSDVAAIKRAFMQSAMSRRLLVDSSKFRPLVFKTVCEVADLDEIITDDNAPNNEVESIRGAGVKLTIAKCSR